MTDKDNVGVGRNPAAIRKSADPLISWYRANKPTVNRLAISVADYKQLVSAVPRTLQNNNISKIGDKFFYSGFELYAKP